MVRVIISFDIQADNQLCYQIFFSRKVTLHTTKPRPAAAVMPTSADTRAARAMLVGIQVARAMLEGIQVARLMDILPPRVMDIQAQVAI